MLGRMTPQVRRVLVWAREAALERAAAHIDPELVLLGLLVERDTTTLSVLHASGVDPARLRRELAAAFERDASSVEELASYSARTRQLLEAAQHEAASTGQAAVGTEHLLIALLREPAGVARELLNAHGLHIDAAQRAARELAGPVQPVDAEAEAGAGELLALHANFGDGARRALRNSLLEARALRHPYIGTEHLLLGAIAEDSNAAARVLRALSIAPADVRQLVEARVVHGPAPVVAESLPFTPRTRMALRFAAEESLHMAATEVGSGQLLLGVLREAVGIAGQVLLALRVDAVEARNRLSALGPAG